MGSATPRAARALPRPHATTTRGHGASDAARAAVHRRGARARTARAPRRARPRARLVLRRLARRDGRHGARARGAGAGRPARPLPARRRTSARPRRGASAREPSAPRGWRRSRTPSSGAGSRPSSRRASRRPSRASARCSSSTPPEGYARCCEALAGWDARERLADDRRARARRRRRGGPGDAARARRADRVSDPGRAPPRPRAAPPISRTSSSAEAFTEAVLEHLGQEVRCVSRRAA